MNKHNSNKKTTDKNMEQRNQQAIVDTHVSAKKHVKQTKHRSEKN